jgi:hypothetical protein
VPGPTARFTWVPRLSSWEASGLTESSPRSGLQAFSAAPGSKGSPAKEKLDYSAPALTRRACVLRALLIPLPRSQGSVSGPAHPVQSPSPLSKAFSLPTASMPTSETESVNTENVSGEGEAQGCCGRLW